MSTTEASMADEVLDEPEDDSAVKKTLGLAFWVAVGWIVAITLAAVLAPWLPIADPDEIANGAPPRRHPR